jgi:putative CocE/NonD family hydrolase
VERDVEITGYPVVTLHVTSSHADGAFYVYLEDVDPSGRITYVTEGQLRALHRKVSPAGSPYELQVPYHSFRREDAAPLVPDEAAELRFGLHPTSVLIRKGHKIRILIAGHDAGTFVRIPAEGTPTITIARNRERPSCIDLPMRERS